MWSLHSDFEDTVLTSWRKEAKRSNLATLSKGPNRARAPQLQTGRVRRLSPPAQPASASRVGAAYPLSLQQLLSASSPCATREWDYIYDQKNLHDKEKVYLKGKDKIVPPFRFGVEDVATKMWFHKLAYPGQCLTNSHLDIIFYYLRKKGKYAKEPKVKFTTTDCLFFKTIHALYEKFIAQKKNLSLITAQHAIADYIRGRKMLCGSPWHLCDHVFFIIHMETESHWILGRLNIEERRVYMYNSLSTAMKDSAAIKACQPFAVLLPHFFALFDEFKKENKPICLDPFEAVKVDGLPQQTSNDCGCFVASFAEYFIDMKPIPPIFDVEKHRDRLAVLFYKYARMKEVEFIDSEDEAPPKGPKKNLS
ncbi:hypothetical protein G4B88_015785 [Cannabis sativa]|uniref:Ubiquitin-like protease family profile domain-containing protein n=1 Tax=Cannabis sativa TaxID=3483 RepID=A0A7J6EQD1_CANSA|nr:hypothetical protein G4B88_015785 [Cannabis sativa]